MRTDHAAVMFIPSAENRHSRKGDKKRMLSWGALYCFPKRTRHICPIGLVLGGLERVVATVLSYEK